MAREVKASGEVSISVTRLKEEATPVLRACITSFRATREDIQRLVRGLNGARRRAAAGA